MRRIIAVDGHGGSGKTTLAASMTGPGVTVVHTDDLAWHHSFFDWAQLLVDDILVPYLAGTPVRYRPPGWVKKGREGAIVVPEDTTTLIVEGTGAGRLEVAGYLDELIWVDVDLDVARGRLLARDGADAADFIDERMAEEIPFLGHHRPWERADRIIRPGQNSPAPDSSSGSR